MKFTHVRIHLSWEYTVLSVHSLAFVNVQMKLQYLEKKG